MKQICQKRVLLIKKRKSDYHKWILYISMSLAVKSALKLTILICWTKCAWKGYLQCRTEKVTITIEFYRSKLVRVLNSTKNLEFWFVSTNLPKKSISDKKQKREQHHLILHISMGLNSRFQFTLIKRVFTVLDRKCEHHHWLLHVPIN